jgi:hypothetical protein
MIIIPQGDRDFGQASRAIIMTATCIAGRIATWGQPYLVNGIFMKDYCNAGPAETQ